jgi:hypothetical protein
MYKLIYWDYSYSNPDIVEPTLTVNYSKSSSSITISSFNSKTNLETWKVLDFLQELVYELNTGTYYYWEVYPLILLGDITEHSKPNKLLGKDVGKTTYSNIELKVRDINDYLVPRIAYKVNKSLGLSYKVSTERAVKV